MIVHSNQPGDDYRRLQQDRLRVEVDRLAEMVENLRDALTELYAERSELKRGLQKVQCELLSYQQKYGGC